MQGLPEGDTPVSNESPILWQGSEDIVQGTGEDHHEVQSPRMSEQRPVPPLLAESGVAVGQVPHPLC